MAEQETTTRHGCRCLCCSYTGAGALAFRQIKGLKRAKLALGEIDV